MTNAWKLGEEKSYAKGWANGAPGSIAFKKMPRPETHYNPAVLQTASSKIGNSPGKTNGLDYTVGDRPIDVVINKFRQRLIARGARGFIGLQRVFKIMDDDNSKNLDMAEFQKAMKDFRVDLKPVEIDLMFKEFDRDGSQRIDYDEFVRGIRGPMNALRQALAMKAFAIMDRDKSGVIELSDIKGVYNGKFHPDVKSGKKTEDEVLMEFLETFETHHSIMTGNAKDSKVTKEEWIEYYNNVSASIDRDDYFELMMNSAWNLDGSRVDKKAWASEL